MNHLFCVLKKRKIINHPHSQTSWNLLYESSIPVPLCLFYSKRHYNMIEERDWEWKGWWACRAHEIAWHIQGMTHEPHTVDLECKSIPAWLQLQGQVDKFSYWKTSRYQQHGEWLLMIGRLNYYSCQYILTTSSPKSSHWKATVRCYFAGSIFNLRRKMKTCRE